MDVNLLWSFYNTYIYQSITLDTLKIKYYFSVVVQLLSRVRLFVTPRTAERQASLSFTISWSFLKLMSIESMMDPNISSSVVPFSSCLQSFPVSGSFPTSQFFTSGDEYYWSFSFSISLSKEYSGLISFRIDWFDLLAIQVTLKSLPQYHSSKLSILQCSAFLHDYWENHSFDYMDLCWQSNVPAF